MFTRRASVLMLLAGVIFLSQEFPISLRAQDKARPGQTRVATETNPNESEFTMARETPYYKTSPQQGRAPDGNLAPGAKVRLLKRGGAYCLVQSADGMRVYVSTDALHPVQEAEGKNIPPAGSSGEPAQELKTNSSNLIERKIPLRDEVRHSMIKPGLPEGTYVVAESLKVGIILRIEGNNEVLAGTFAEPITSLCFSRSHTNLYFLNSIDRKVWQAPVFPKDPAHILNAVLECTGKGLVQCVRVNNNGTPTFSNAAGFQDGSIWSHVGPSSVEPKFETDVSVKEIGGYWTGHFDYGPNRDLYLSDGNHTNASLWIRHDMGGAIEKIHSEEGKILGICCVLSDDGTLDDILFTNGTGTIKRFYHATKTAEVVYTSPNNYKFCDIDVGGILPSN